MSWASHGKIFKELTELLDGRQLLSGCSTLRSVLVSQVNFPIRMPGNFAAVLVWLNQHDDWMALTLNRVPRPWGFSLLFPFYGFANWLTRFFFNYSSLPGFMSMGFYNILLEKAICPDYVSTSPLGFWGWPYVYSCRSFSTEMVFLRGAAVPEPYCLAVRDRRPGRVEMI